MWRYVHTIYIYITTNIKRKKDKNKQIVMNEKFEQLFSELYGLEILTSSDMGKHIIKFCL